MNEELLLNKNIMDICYETINVEGTKKREQIIVNVIRFYIKHILGTKNIYLVIFLSKKLERLNDTTDNDIYRKLLVEIYLLIAICNKPNKDEKKIKQKAIKVNESEAESVLLNELNTYRKENVIHSCIKVLQATKADLLWRVAENISELPHYIKALCQLYQYDNKKELLFEAYNALSKGNYFYDNNEYNNIIFQCMVKINYIYEEKNKFDKHMEIYLKCLNYPLKDMSVPIQYNRISYMHVDNRKSLDIVNKPQQEYMFFEKVTKTDKSTSNALVVPKKKSLMENK